MYSMVPQKVLAPRRESSISTFAKPKSVMLRWPDGLIDNERFERQHAITNQDDQAGTRTGTYHRLRARCSRA